MSDQEKLVLVPSVSEAATASADYEALIGLIQQLESAQGLQARMVYPPKTTSEFIELAKLFESTEVVVLAPGWEHNQFALALASLAKGLGVQVDYVSDAVVAPDSNGNERPHEEAARIVLGPRGAYYDNPYDNFTRTAHIWTGLLYSKLQPGEQIEAKEVSLMMVGLKLAREVFRHKRDNLTDSHGYLITHEMVLEEMKKRGEH